MKTLQFRSNDLEDWDEQDLANFFGVSFSAPA